LLAQILEARGDLAENLTVGVVGNADTTRLSDPLKPRGDVDAIAKISSSSMMTSPT
jgi:hypothetical protein